MPSTARTAPSAQSSVHAQDNPISVARSRTCVAAIGTSSITNGCSLRVCVTIQDTPQITITTDASTTLCANDGET
jgi:hypothetical protein